MRRRVGAKVGREVSDRQTAISSPLAGSKRRWDHGGAAALGCALGIRSREPQEKDRRQILVGKPVVGG